MFYQGNFWVEIISLSGESLEKTSGACWTRPFSYFFHDDIIKDRVFECVSLRL